jgi:hypothetical protein
MHKEQKNTLLPMTRARESPTRERATSKTKQVDAKTEKQQAIKLTFLLCLLQNLVLLRLMMCAML